MGGSGAVSLNSFIVTDFCLCPLLSQVAALAVLQDARTAPMAVCVKGKPPTNVAAAPEQQALQAQYRKYCPYVLYYTSRMSSVSLS